MFVQSFIHLINVCVSTVLHAGDVAASDRETAPAFMVLQSSQKETDKNQINKCYVRLINVIKKNKAWSRDGK